MLWVRRRPERLLRRLRDARRILFVCHGNVIRSAFAAHYLSSATTGAAGPVISSAGLHADVGGTANPRAVDRARRWRVDLREHRTTPLSEEAIVSADVILAMELGHIVAIRRRYHRARQKVFLLGCLAPVTPLEVADPIGKDHAAFDACFEHIVSAMTPMVGLFTELGGRTPGRRTDSGPSGAPATRDPTGVGS